MFFVLRRWGNRKLPLQVDSKSWTFLAGFVLEGSPIKKSRLTESQIVAILKEWEAALAVAQLARKYGISAAIQWKAKYAGAGVPEPKRLRELEAENAKLKRNLKLRLVRKTRAGQF